VKAWHLPPQGNSPVATKKTTPAEVYQLKVTLRGSKPPIWRRFQVPADITLARLHDALQDVMGWTNSHLHQFVIAGTYYGVPYGDFMDLEVIDERRVKLNQVVTKVKSKFTYEYDFGDSWEHVVVLEKVLPPEPGVRYPVCLAGARNCPPEDCGGVWGYDDLVQALQKPGTPRQEELLEWIGGEFDPEAFDVGEVNRRIRRSGR
jgi:Plasmid pRiA4b ORF-3-like protein